MEIFLFVAEPALRRRLVDRLRDAECRIVTPDDFSEAAEAIVLRRFDLILCDYWAQEIDGVAFFHLIKEHQPRALKVLMAGYPIRATWSDLRWAGIDQVVRRSDVVDRMDRLKSRLLADADGTGCTTTH
jgi:DNA-binding NtrC family response regulator